jgi:D-aspartate ligase
LRRDGAVGLMRESGSRAPVVVLGVGPTALGTLRCLGRAGHRPWLVTRPADLAGLSRFGRNRVAAIEPSTPEALVELCAELGVRPAVVIPCTDEWVKVVCRLPPESDLLASVSAPEVVEQLIDKERFAAALARLDVPHPNTAAVESEDDLDGELEGCFLKPRQSQRFAQHYHRKALTFDDRPSAVHAFRQMNRVGAGAILQEYVPGPATAHYFIDGFVRPDRTVAALFARRRLRMYPLDFGNSSLMVSVPLADVQQPADDLTRFLSAIGYRGVFSAEFKQDTRDGVFKLLEVNARPWWYVEFAAHCGVDFCELVYRDATGLTVPGIDVYAIGRRCVFLPQDLRAFRALRSADELGLRAWVRSVLGAHATVFAFDDPLPALGLPLIAVQRQCRLVRERRAPAV